MKHAFEDEGYLRVEFKTDAKNERSRPALEKIGATFEGIHRKHYIVRGGERRDSAWYSVIDDDWPAVKARLETTASGLATSRPSGGGPGPSLRLCRAGTGRSRRGARRRRSRAALKSASQIPQLGESERRSAPALGGAEHPEEHDRPAATAGERDLAAGRRTAALARRRDEEATPGARWRRGRGGSWLTRFIVWCALTVAS